jgi:hypothetical protein
VMAVLVAQDHPGTIRRTPSSGDGGVDILIPDGDGFHVRQVKGYVGRIGARRKREIEESFKTVSRAPRLQRPITRWGLTVPIDPTSGEQDWFEQLTNDAPFPCDWDGEVFWNKLAARHSHVIDYYLRDGRSRVEQRAQMLLRISSSAADPLTPNDVAGHLELMRASLNREDPHYRYEFVTGPAARHLQVPEGCVLSLTTEVEDSALMIQVFPKHEYALEDAPIGGNLNITVFKPDEGIDIRDQFESFRTFGTAVDLPEGSLEGELFAPGGLGGSIQGGSGRMGPNLITDPPQRTRIRLVHPEDGVNVELGLITESATRGGLGGIEMRAADEARVLSAVFRVHPGTDPPLTFVVKGSNLSGRAIQEIIPAVRLLASFRPPMRFEWLAQFGNQVLAGQTIEEDHSLMSAMELSVFEDLAAIQDHVRDVVIVPDEIPAAGVEAIARIAQLIRRREIPGTWDHLDVNLKEGVDRKDVVPKVGGEASLLIQQDRILRIGEKEYQLGPVQYLYATAKLAGTQPDDPTVLRFVPGADSKAIERLGALPSASKSESAGTE